MRRGDGGVRQVDQPRMRAVVIRQVGMHLRAGAHDLDPQRAGPAVEFFDPHEGAHRLRLQQDAFGHTLGQGFQQVQAFGGQLVPDRFGHAVIGQDAVHVVVDGAGQRRHLDHHVEAHALRRAAFGLEGADLDLDDMVAQRNPVQRPARCGGFGPFGRMREGKADVGGHGRCPMGSIGCTLGAGGAGRQVRQRRSSTRKRQLTRYQVFMPASAWLSMWQCRSQLPGLSATKATWRVSPGATSTVSRRTPSVPSGSIRWK